jgi:hypothetical protein
LYDQKFQIPMGLTNTGTVKKSKAKRRKDRYVWLYVIGSLEGLGQTAGNRNIQARTTIVVLGRTTGNGERVCALGAACPGEMAAAPAVRSF